MTVPRDEYAALKHMKDRDCHLWAHRSSATAGIVGASGYRLSYATASRLIAGGYITKETTGKQGHVQYSLTDTGRLAIRDYEAAGVDVQDEFV